MRLVRVRVRVRVRIRVRVRVRLRLSWCARAVRACALAWRRHDSPKLDPVAATVTCSPTLARLPPTLTMAAFLVSVRVSVRVRGGARVRVRFRAQVNDGGVPRLVTRPVEPLRDL